MPLSVNIITSSIANLEHHAQEKTRSFDLLPFSKRIVYNVSMRAWVVGILGVCLLPACGFAQGGKFLLGPGSGQVIKGLSPRPGLTPQVQRAARQAALQTARVERISPAGFPAYTKTLVPQIGTIYSFRELPKEYVIASTEALMDFPALAPVWKDGNLFIGSLGGVRAPAVSPVPEFNETHLPGLGTVRSYEGKPDLYGLQVPTRRGHMDHFVPMDMQGIVSRLVNYTRQQNFADQWADIGGAMQYNDVEPLAEHLHQLYRGQGISVKDAQGEEAVFYMLPVEGISYRFDDGLLPIGMSEYVVLFYPQRKVSFLIKQEKETMGKFRLLGNAPKIPQE